MTLQCINHRVLFLKALVLWTWRVKQSSCQQDAVTPIVPNVPLQNEFLIINGQSKRYLPRNLDALSSYELRVSYSSTSSVVMHFGFSCSESVGVAQQRRRSNIMRKMLNAEKVMFRTDATGRVMMPEQRHDNEETCDQVVVTLSATSWGHFASNHPRDRFYYDIVLEKNHVGIPESGGSIVLMTLFLLVVVVGVIVPKWITYMDISALKNDKNNK
ncbi:hypothetical protein M9435_006999 [Picochlorum sp. BPE23]|nr:hypothetical protein M9435_006999 [Picochlorum sp. BPE23]